VKRESSLEIFGQKASWAKSERGLLGEQSVAQKITFFCSFSTFSILTTWKKCIYVETFFSSVFVVILE